MELRRDYREIARCGSNLLSAHMETFLGIKVRRNGMITRDAINGVSAARFLAIGHGFLVVFAIVKGRWF